MPAKRDLLWILGLCVLLHFSLHTASRASATSFLTDDSRAAFLVAYKGYRTMGGDVIGGAAPGQATGLLAGATSSVPTIYSRDIEVLASHVGVFGRDVDLVVEHVVEQGHAAGQTDEDRQQVRVTMERGLLGGWSYVQFQARGRQAIDPELGDPWLVALGVPEDP